VVTKLLTTVMESPLGRAIQLNKCRLRLSIVSEPQAAHYLLDGTSLALLSMTVKGRPLFKFTLNSGVYLLPMAVFATFFIKVGKACK